jgi:hypothetical protein
VNVAVPLASDAVPSVFPLSAKITLPDGVPL